MSLRYLDDQSKLDRFLEVKAKISELQEEYEQLKPEILAAVMEEPEGKTTHLGCEISYYRRRYYEYSDKVKEMDKQLKAAQRYERDSGIAGVTKQQAILQVRQTELA